MTKRWTVLILLAGLGAPGAPAAAETALEAASAEPAAPAAPDGAEADAVQALQALAGAYSARQRSVFMRLVSDEFRGDLAALEDALLKDFQTYARVHLDLIPDQVTLQGPEALVEFHYNLSVVDASGVQTLYSGRSHYVFRREGAAMKLVRMADPVLFGNSLPPAENPLAKPQGTNVLSEGRVPGAQSGLPTGQATITQGSQGFRFASQSQVAPEAADVYAGFLAGELAVNAGGRIESLGAGSLDSVRSISAPTQFAVNASVGERCAIQTLDGTYAILRVTAVTATAVTFEYKYQSNGTLQF